MEIESDWQTLAYLESGILEDSELHSIRFDIRPERKGQGHLRRGSAEVFEKGRENLADKGVL